MSKEPTKEVETVAPATEQYKAKKADLITMVSKCQERKFAEEVDFLEKLGGDHVFQDTLSVDYKKGISASEEENRRTVFGTNIRDAPPPKKFFELVCDALEDFTLRILLFAAIISIITNVIVEKDHREIAWIEGFAIMVAVAISVTVTSINDYQKEKQFRKLNEAAANSRSISVWRDGVITPIHPSRVVTGDICKLEGGMDIPADMLVLESFDITCDESAMTGEADLIKKCAYHDCLAKRDQLIAEDQQATAGHHDVPAPILLSGTKIVTGEGKGMVLVVGSDSCVGKIRDLVTQEASATPLQQKLETIARDIGKFGLVMGLLTLVVLIIRFIIDRAVTSTFDDGSKWLLLIEYFIVAVTIVVVAIPEGLPLSVTLALAFSIKKMLKDRNLVRKLRATETMGGADAICSDKTGTLTQNKMTLTTIWNGSEVAFDPRTKTGKFTEIFPSKHHDILRQALACNSSATLVPEQGSKTEVALLEFLQNNGEDYLALREKWPPSHKFTFSSKRKRMSIILEGQGESGRARMHIKGASEIVLYSCHSFYDFKENKIVPITEDLKAKLEEEITNMADKALRTICFGYKDLRGDEDLKTKDDKDVFEVEKNGFILLGILGIQDILRKEVTGAVAKCKAAGITVRMVTGDNKITAKAIARECGIIDPKDDKVLVMEGPEFIERTGGVVCKKCRTKECGCPRDQKSADEQKKEIRVDTIANGDEFDKIYKQLAVLARSRPEDKYALVTGLIERGSVVAVTGDGTNDAPALKKADVGFAMNSGTQVCQEAADIILLDDNFASIVEAVKWGRNIFDNIRKFLQYQLTINIVMVTITLVGAAVLRESIIKAVNMLWTNLIMDTLGSLALATEPPGEELLQRKPHGRDEYIISKRMAKQIITSAIYEITVILVLVFTGDKWIPETLNKHYIDPDTGANPYYSDSGFVRSGRGYMLTSTDEDYRRYEDRWGPSRHYTVIFSAFIYMQVFNFVNARKLNEERNVYAGFLKNPMFFGIVSVVAIAQTIMSQFGGRPLNVSFYGMNWQQWLISLSFGLGIQLWNLLMKLLPFQKICPALGNKLSDPVHSDSKVLGMRRSHSSLTRKYSSIAADNKAGSLSKVQHHAPRP